MRGLKEKEREENDAPEREGEAEEAIREGLVVAAFVPEEIADGDIDESRGDERRNLEDLEGVGGGPERKEYGEDHGGFQPKFFVGVKLGAEEEAKGGETKKRVIQGAENDVGADPGGERGTKIVESVECPADGPVEKIVLALERIDVGEEHSNEERSEKQAERDRVW